MGRGHPRQATKRKVHASSRGLDDSGVDKEKNRRIRLITEAREAAAATESFFPPSFKQPRVDIARLAREMGLSIVVEPSLEGRAILERVDEGAFSRTLPGLWGRTGRQIGRILVRPGMSESTRRFAVAHELGHVVLEDAPELAANLEAAEKETFANIFAAELLIAQSHRAALKSDFREAETPTELMNLANAIGTSIGTILKFAQTHEWFSDLDRLWLDVGHYPDPTTALDRRLRVRRCYIDGRRWWVEKNVSVKALFGEDAWLIGNGERVIIKDDLLVKLRERKDKYSRAIMVERKTLVRSVRLLESRWADGPKHLLSATVSDADQS